MGAINKKQRLNIREYSTLTRWKQNKMKTILCTISDDRQGRKGGIYAKTQAYVSERLKDFIKIHPWTIQDVLKEWNYSLLNEIDPGMNGRVYKPLVILKELSKLNDGDFLIYNDVSPEIWNYTEPLKTFSLDVIQKLTTQNNDILTAFVKWDYLSIPRDGLGLHLHRYFTLNSCMDKMGLREYENSYMHASGMVCIRKTPETVKFVDEWLYWNLDAECSSLQNWENEREFKAGHRHDQSISGLLLNKRNADLVDIFHNHMNPYNFLQFCIPDMDYKFINSNSSTGDRDLEFKKIFIRPGSKVINQAGIEMMVYRIEGDRYIVGQHEQSCYGAFWKELTLI